VAESGPAAALRGLARRGRRSPRALVVTGMTCGGDDKRVPAALLTFALGGGEG